MDSSAFFFGAVETSTAATGHDLRPPFREGHPAGVNHQHRGPRRDPSETQHLAGKRYGSGIRPLGPPSARVASRCAHRRAPVAHDGGSRNDSCSRRRLRVRPPPRAPRETGSGVGSWKPSVDTRQVRSAGRAAQPGTSARRSGTGRKGARTACRRPRAGAATGACTAAGAAAAAVSFSEARARRSGTAGRAHTSLAGQEQRHRCRDRARSRARRSGRGLGSVRRQHLELRRNGAARHTPAARETAGDCHERTRRSEDGEVI